MDDTNSRLSARKMKKRERNKERFEEKRRYKDCDLGCGGQMSWCSFCQVYSNNCCVDWGTCQCS